MNLGSLNPFTLNIISETFRNRWVYEVYSILILVLPHQRELLNALILKGKYSEFFIQGITYLLIKPTHFKQSKLKNLN